VAEFVTARCAHAVKALVLAFLILVCIPLEWTGMAAPAAQPMSFAQLSTKTPAPAKAAQPMPERLKRIEAQIEQITSAFKRKDITDPELQALRIRLEPLLNEAQTVSDALEADSEAAKARLDQLGPKPKKGAPAESAEIAAQRLQLQTNFDEADGLLKRAKVALVRIRQLESDILNRRRAILQSLLLKQSRPVLHPMFWYEAGREVPAAFASVAQLGAGWLTALTGTLKGGYWKQFTAFLLSLVALYTVLWIVSRRVVPRREAGNPDEFEKVVKALWVAAIVFAVPSVVAAALFEGLRYFGVLPGYMEPLATVLLQSVHRIALIAGLARGILAPAKPDWRLVKMETARAVRLSGLVFQVICITAAIRIVDVVLTMIAAPLILSQALVAVGTLTIVMTIAATLYGTAVSNAQLDAELGPVVDPQYSFMGVWRLGVWASVISIVIANLLGYFNVAEFVVDQMIRVTFILVAAFLLVKLIDTGLTRALEPASFAGNLALTTFGLRKDSIQQTAIVLSGLFRLIVYIAAGVALLAPLGVETVTIASTLNALLFGFDIGGVRISPASVLIAFGLLIGGYLAARALQNWLERSYLPSTHLDSGLQNSISTSAKYVGIIAAIAFALGYLGLNFEKLAFVAGALSLGIGFGLQAIVSNFVSGLILLWERSIKVGDWVVVGTDEGYVRRINVRSTEIETFDRQMVIVPNSNLMTGVVKNWVRNNTTGRIIVPVGVSYDTDPNQVREILLACAKTHDLVMEHPEPYVNFAGFGDSSLDFELRAYVSNIDKALSVRSHMRFEIFRCLKKANIEIPFPQRDLNLRDFDKLAQLVEKNRTVKPDSPDTSQ
jgi:potassium-dependent mechanosensitive channel